MFRFENPQYLYLLALIPLLVLLRVYVVNRRRKNIKRFGDPSLLKTLMPDVSRVRPALKFWLTVTALALVIVMLARPQMGTKISKETRNGIEAMIALDISNSMKAEDVIPSRLDKSKMLIERMVDNFNNDKVGLVVFAGDAFIQLPITSDYVSAKMFMQSISPSLIAAQGTNIAEAIRISMNSFTQQEKVGRAIIVITDGEDHEGGAEEAAKAALKKGIRVFVLGVGNANGAPIPDGQGGYMKDETGGEVMSALNEQMCRDVAKAGGGAYIHVDNTNTAQEQLDNELTKLQKGELSSVIYSEYDEQFQAFGILALLLLILEVCIMESKNPLLKGLRLFNKRSFTAVLLCLLTVTAVQAQGDRQCIRNGNRYYHQKQWAQAEVEYRKALAQNAANTQARYNLGCALMMQQKDSAAVEQYQKAAQTETNKLRRAKANHNIGVICQNHQMYGDAIKAYQQSLRDNPKDDETRYNLALCKQLNKQNQQQQNQQQNKNNQDNKNDKDKNQQQNQQQNKDKDKQNQDKNQQKKEQEQMSKENAEQLLNAAIQDEKATQQRLQKAMQQPARGRSRKNW